MRFVPTLIFCALMYFGWGQDREEGLLRGSRPIIDLSKIPVSSYEPGIVSVKFKANFSPLLENTIPAEKNTFFLFGIGEIDRLNKRNKVKNASRLFINSTESKYQLHRRWGMNLWYNLSLPKDADIKKTVEEYIQSGYFEVVEPLYKIETTGIRTVKSFVPDDPKFIEQWNLKNTGQLGGSIGRDLGMTDAWDIEKGKPEVIVAMIDRGIQYNHPDLAQNMWTGIGYNFVTNNGIISPEDHGTCTAGIVAGVNNNNTGISGIAGGDGSLNSGARLMSCQIFMGSNTNGNIADALVWAADHGACIASNSWVFTNAGVYRQSVLDAIDYFCSNGGGNVLQGGLVIAAAGNNGDERFTYPACYEKVIGVASTNNKDIRSPFSNYGNWVDISAPAGDGLGDASDIPTTSINGYAFFSGTSACAPHVAGVAALIASKLSGKASASDVRDILLSTTDEIYQLNPGYIGKLGTGRVNAFKALQKAQSFLINNAVSPPISFTANADCHFINLSWTKNPNNNDVLIVYNENNSIGIPNNGSSYNIGENVTGLGKVIYKGNGSNFNFAIPNNNVFQYFKIWSLNATNQYSYGKQLEILTGPVYPINDNAGYDEGFEGLSFPYQSLRVNNPDASFTWERTNGAKHDGSKCAFIDNFDYTAINQADFMYLPYLKVNNVDSIKLSFWKAYRTNVNADSLVILVSTDCGKTYSPVWQKGGNDLATVPGNQATAYIPADADWKKQEITFSIPLSAEKVIIGFKNINGHGQILYLDDISVTTNVRPERLLNDGIVITPNPFSKQFTVRLFSSTADLKAISIFNSLGQKVFSQTYAGDAGSSMVFDMAKFAKGVYHVRFDYTNKSVTKKIVKL